MEDIIQEYEIWWTRLVGGPAPWFVDPCRGHGVPEDFNKFDRLGFGQMGRNGQGTPPLVLFPRAVVKDEDENRGLTGHTRCRIPSNTAEENP